MSANSLAEEEARRLHWEMLRWFDSWQIESNGNRLRGGLRILEGGAQAWAGGMLCATVVGCFLGGGAMFLNGADIAGAGLGTAVDGVRHKTTVETLLGPTAAKIQNWFAFASTMGISGVQILSAVRASSAAQGALLRAQLAAEEAAGAQLPQAITGYTRHGLNQAISRDGVGVSTRAIMDAFKNPTSIVGQSGGRFTFTGRDAVVVLNADGKVITTWATNSAGVRVTP